MINKRLLVKNLLAHNDENSFYDKSALSISGKKKVRGSFLNMFAPWQIAIPKTIHLLLSEWKTKTIKLSASTFSMIVKYKTLSMPI